MRIAPLAMCLLAVAGTAQAQDNPLARADLPRSVETRLSAILESPATKQFRDTTTIRDTLTADVVVQQGPLHLLGKIDGQLIVIDGNVDFAQGSEVTGDVTVINGTTNGLENATVGGTVTTYGEGFNFFHRGEKVFAVNTRHRRVYRDDDHRDWGRSTFDIKSSWNYNRVEGLPVQFGPVIETSGSNPTRVEAHAIWRTEAGSLFDTEDWGYSLSVEQFLGGHRDFRVGGNLHSVVDPIEGWQLSNSEASLATFLLHEDYRDYFLREGWSAYVKLTPRASGITATLSYNDDDQVAQAARSPWTLFGDGAWRLQPLVAEGRLRSATAGLVVDRRNDTSFPSAGFLVRGEVTQGIGGRLAIPAAYNPLTATSAAAVPVPFNTHFTSALVDARVYRRVNYDGTLSLRVVGGGMLGNKAAPPQFQHALGGAGTLPGYALFSQDCGARRVPVVRNDNPAKDFFPYYGCDRTAMVSAEYRGGFDLHFGGFGWWDEEGEEERWNVDTHPSWIVFFDAGRGWASAEAKARGAIDTRELYDVGGGILIGDFGIYGAVPLNGTDRGMKFFVRLDPRF